MTPYSPYTRRRGSGATLFGPLLLFLGGLAFLVVTLPMGGLDLSGLPGGRRVMALVDRVPVPWKAPRPVHVLPPPVDSAAPPLGGQAAPPALVPLVPPVGGSSSLPAPAAVPAAGPLSAAIAARPLPTTVRLDGVRHQWQTWNNCGPATIAMALSYFGRAESQAHAAAFLKPNANDKNVNPDELVAYVRSTGLLADWLVSGSLERIKRLVANGVPVVVETWHTPQPNDGLGHYRLLVGYDEPAQQLIFFDSFQPPGQNVRLPYRTFDEDWRAFNRTYIPVYDHDKELAVSAITGADRDEAHMRERSLAAAQDEAAARPADAYSWFNLGTALTGMGRTAEAAQAFDRARTLRLPWRMLWYQFAPFEAYLAEGRYNDVLALAGANLQQAADLEESLYYRGRALEALGRKAEARAAYQAAIRFNPRFGPAQHALSLLG